MKPEQLAARQHGLVARWQLLDGVGLTPAAARWWARDLRAPFPGVYLTGWAPITPLQWWWAATLTTPTSWLAGDSAGAAYGVRSDPGLPVTVVRPGGGHTEDQELLEVRYSLTVADHVGHVRGLRITSPERTVVDVWALLEDTRERHRLVREAIRLRVTTADRLLRAIRSHRGRRHIASLRRFVERYSHLPFHRCRSDAEAYALTVLDDAGVEIPLVNTRQAGEEADLCWPGPRRIIEIDGPQFHLFADVDARKTEAWVRAGFTVDRLPSPLLYADPTTLLDLAPGGTNGGLWLP